MFPYHLNSGPLHPPLRRCVQGCRKSALNYREITDFESRGGYRGNSQPCQKSSAKRWKGADAHVAEQAVAGPTRRSAGLRLLPYYLCRQTVFAFFQGNIVRKLAFFKKMLASSAEVKRREVQKERICQRLCKNLINASARRPWIFVAIPHDGPG